MLAITGSSGFVGRSISPYLPFPQKRLVTKMPEEISSFETSRYIIGNLTNPSDLLQLVEGASTLVHLACRSNPRNSNHKIQEDISQELLSTIQLFEIFAKNNPTGHIIFASTGGNMYQADTPYIPRTEKNVPMPSSGYSIQKLAIENYLRLFCNIYGIKGTVLRISNPYGTLLPAARAHGLIGIAFNKLLSNDTLSIIDSPKSVRDYLHLDDLTSAFCLIIDKPPKNGEFQLFNVSSGLGYNINEILNAIEKTSSFSINKEYHPASFTCKPSWSVLSNQHIYEKLGWSPKVDLEAGLEKMWQNIKQVHQC